MSYEDQLDQAAVFARKAVATVLQRSEYEALKLLAWRFRFGARVVAVSASRAAEVHAIYVSSEEIIHRLEDTGIVVSETWLRFLLRNSSWRAAQWPTDNAHADEIVRRARSRIGTAEQGDARAGGSLRFAHECYVGDDAEDPAASSSTTLATLATGGAAAGAAAAAPYAVSTVTAYSFGIIPVTTTVFSGGVVAAGAAVGAAAGALLIAPIYWSWRKSSQEAAIRRLPFGVVNDTSQALRVRVYSLGDTLCLFPVAGMGGTTDGEASPGDLLELDPPDSEDAFTVVVTRVVAEGYSLWGGGCQHLQAAMRRGGIYSVRTLEAVVEGAPDIEAVRIPRSVLPAYGPV